MDLYTDHTPTWNVLANRHKLSHMTLLEYGCGLGTIPLCGLFRNCVSVELYHDKFLTTEWFNKVSGEIKKHGVHNWQGRVQEVSTQICNVEHEIRDLDICKERTFEGSSVQELKYIVEQDIKKYNPHVVFVDPGIHMRGEIAKIIMDNYWANIVVVHDYNWPDCRYGYQLLQNPKDYIFELPVPGGLGTAVYSFIKPHNHGG